MNTTIKRGWFYLSVAVNILIVLFLIGKRAYYSTHFHMSENEMAIYDSLNDERTRFYSYFPLDSGDIVFVGSSLTESFSLDNAFPGARVRNRGIAGNQTPRILGRIGNIARSKPSKLFLESGVNDIRGGISVDSVMVNFQRIVDTIKKYSPKTEIIVQSTFPVGENFKAYMSEIGQINKRLVLMCGKDSLRFVNLYPSFIKNGYLNKSITIDGIHFNGAGYKIWKEGIEGLVR